MSPIIPGYFRDATIEETRPHMLELMRFHRNVPERFARSAAAVIETPFLTQIEAQADSIFTNGKLAVLCGPPDGGKTFAAHALGCLGYLRVGFNFLSYQAQAFFKMAWDDLRRADYNDAWDHYGLLILDDLGAESATQRGTLEANLYDGLNNRYAGCLPTCITSNYPAAKLADLYPDFAARLHSRFKEWAVVIEVRNAPRLRERGTLPPPEPLVEPVPTVVIMDGKEVALRGRAAQPFDVKAAIGALAGKLADTSPPVPPLREPSPDDVVAAEREREKLANYIAAGAIQARETVL